MRPYSAVTFSLLVMVLGAWLFLTAGDDEALRKRKVTALMSAEIESGPKIIPLNQHYLILWGPGEQKKVPAILVERVYRFKALIVEEGKPRIWERSLFSYEIRAVGENDLFTWNICSLGRPLGMFRLFSNERGENHLAWVEGRSVCFSRIKERRDRLVAITEALASGGAKFPGVVRVPTDRLINRNDHYAKDRPANAFYSELMVQSIEAREDGTIKLKVSGPRRNKVFIFLFDGKEWGKE